MTLSIKSLQPFFQYLVLLFTVFHLFSEGWAIKTARSADTPAPNCSDPSTNPLASLSFNLEEFLAKFADVKILLKDQRELTFSEALSQGKIKIPEELKNLQGTRIYLLTAKSKEGQELIIPLPLSNIHLSLVSDGQGPGKSLQKCLEEGILTEDQIKELLKNSFQKFLKNEEEKILKSLDKKQLSPLKTAGQPIPEFSNIERFLPKGAASSYKFPTADSTNGKFDHWALRGVLSFNQAAIPQELGFSQGLGIDPKSLNGSLNCNMPFGSIGGNITYLYGFVFPALSFHYNLQQNTATLMEGPGIHSLQHSLGLAFWKNWICPYGGISFNLNSQNSFSIGLGPVLVQNRQVNYLGPYKGQEPRLQGLHGIQVGDKKLKGGLVDLGVFGPVAAVSGMGAAIRTGYYKTVISDFTTHLPLATIQAYLKDRRKWDVTRLFTKIIKDGMPDIKEPLNWLPLDQVTLGFEREAFILPTVGVDVIPGFLAAVRAGLLKSLVLRYQMTVKKLPGKKVEVVLSDIELNNTSYFMRFFQLLGINNAKGLEFTKSQTLRLDLENPKAVEYYTSLVQGHLPSFFSLVFKKREKSDFSTLIHDFDKERENLLEMGVERISMEKVEFPFNRKSAQAKILWLPTPQIPGFFYEKVKGKGKSLTTDGQFGLSRDVQVMALHKEKFVGEQSQGITTVGRSLHVSKDHPEDSRFVDLKISAFSDDNRAGTVSNNKKIHYLNENFGLDIGDFKEDHGLERRKIFIEETLDATDLEYLAGMDKKIIEEMASFSSKDKERTLELRRELEYKTPGERFKIIQKFIKKYKWQGVAEIFQLLKLHSKRPFLVSESSIYAKPLQKSLELLAIYRDDHFSAEDQRKIWISDKSSKKVIKEFFTKVGKNISDLRKALEYLNDDPFFPPQDSPRAFERPKDQTREFMEAKLKSALQSMEALLDLKSQGFTEEEAKIIIRKSRSRMSWWQ